MKFDNVVISDYAAFWPEQLISSEEIEAKLAPVYRRLNLPHGRLELMTGIKTRGFWELGTRPSSLSAEAGKRLFAKSKISPKDIDLIIHASVCRDFLEPSTASVVHQALELKPECMLFDLSNACLGVMSSFMVAANMIETGLIKHALIVSGENGGPLLMQTIDFLNNNQELTRKSIKKYFANLTIGSAAVAFTLSHKDAARGHRLLGGASMTDSSANVLCQGDGDTSSLMMETDSEELMKAGVVLAQKTWHNFQHNLDIKPYNIEWVVGHQVGRAHEELTMKTLGLAEHKTHTTYEVLGNTGSAALPITLIDMIEKQKVEAGELVALLGIGSGLNSIMMGVQW